jgi:hypothetical protein
MPREGNNKRVRRFILGGVVASCLNADNDF